ncbi:MAG: hypothetical protein NVSMB14_01240 [Isosphaeraceae bacterium]
MMSWLSEDPWPVAGTLATVAVVCFILLRVTQQGRFLLWGFLCLALGVATVVIEHFWVTDVERIDDAIYGMTAALQRSDGKTAAGFLADDAVVTIGDTDIGSLRGDAVLDHDLFEHALSDTKFDLLQLSGMTVKVGSRTRQGTARFKVLATGSYNGNVKVPFTAAGTEWDFGCREVSPGVWKIERITPTSLPANSELYVRGILWSLMKAGKSARR